VGHATITYLPASAISFMKKRCEQVSYVLPKLLRNNFETLLKKDIIIGTACLDASYTFFDLF
jgi:hypothetical protein